MYKLLLPFVLLLLAVGISVLSDRPLQPADFTISNGPDVTTLDLQRMSWMQDLRVANCLFEPLVQNDVFSDGYDIIPAAAQSWEISPDGLVYTFHMRPGAKWSNGDAVTADDFVYAWRRGLLPDTASDYIAFFWMIKGGKEFYDWRTEALSAFANKTGPTQDAHELWQMTLDKFEEMVSLKAPDSMTFQVELEQPVPYFLDICAFIVLGPVYPPLLKQYERVDPKSARLISERGWTKPPHLISNGPFKLTLWRFKRDMRLEANEHYWNRDALNIDSIAIPSIEDPNSQVIAFQTGAVDWIATLAVNYRGDIWAQKAQFYDEHREQYESLKAQGLDQFEIDRALPSDERKNIHAIPSFATYFWNFNCLPNLPDGRKNPLHDRRVRKALALVVDKRAIVHDVRRLGEPVARTLVPPNSVGGYTSPAGLDCISDATTDAQRQAIIDQARALLAEAGYPDPSKLPTVELVFNKDSGHDLIAQSIARNWEEYLGVPVMLAQKELKVYKDDLKRSNFMTSRAGWYGDYGDPTTFLDLLRADDGNNDRKYSSPQYDGLLDQAAAEKDPAKRMAILTQAERLIMEEDIPMIPIYHYVTMYMFDADKISGIAPHPRTKQLLYLIDVLKDGKGTDIPRAMNQPAPGGAN